MNSKLEVDPERQKFHLGEIPAPGAWCVRSEILHTPPGRMWYIGELFNQILQTKMITDQELQRSTPEKAAYLYHLVDLHTRLAQMSPALVHSMVELLMYPVGTSMHQQVRFKACELLGQLLKESSIPR